jgi:hypothetical protein
MSLPSQTRWPEELSRAQLRRHDLAEAMTALEKAIAGPASVAGWLDRVEASLGNLRGALDAHIEEVEGPQGLLDEIVAVDPRLTPYVEDLRKDHIDLLGAWVRAEATARAVRGGFALPSKIRRRVTTLLGRLTLHRQAGADLVYEAHSVDIAAAD